jgi:TB2/DP1, HVA22 family
MFFEFLTRVVVLYCGYKAFKAIETTTKQDDTQHLMFFTLYSFIYATEFFTDIILSIIPFYSTLKLCLVVFLGPFHGATSIYSVFVRPILLKYETQIDESISNTTATMLQLGVYATRQANQAVTTAAIKQQAIDTATDTATATIQQQHDDAFSQV